MTMNSSGPISLGGTTAGQSIELENGGPGTAQVSLDDTAVRTLAGVPGSGTTIIMPTNFYGKSNTVYLNLTIASNTQNYDVYANASASPLYVAGNTVVTVTVNPGVDVGSSSAPSYAMLVPSSFNPGDSVTIVNNGYIVGAGGAGGTGASGNLGQGPIPSQSIPAPPGGTGGNALYVARPTTVTNNSVIGAGGGGGGGAGSRVFTSTGPGKEVYGGGGGGGGAGYTGGGGGSGGPGAAGIAPNGTKAGSPGNPGGGGTLTTGGGGGTPAPYNNVGAVWPPGGPGGGLGAAGAAGGSWNTASGLPGPGGSGGNYITGNPFVTWPATGTRYGGVA